MIIKKYIYELTQDEAIGYDTYDSCVVCAYSEAEAKTIHPSGNNYWFSSAWVNTPEKVNVEYLGVAKEDLKIGLILSSFNAG